MPTINVSKFKMRRTGQFLAKFTNTAGKCGPANAQPIFEYEVNLTVAPELDDNGFIIDNLVIADYFTQTYGSRGMLALSCERIAQHAVRSIHAACVKAGTPVEFISVSISGMPGAWLTAEWSK